MFASEPYLGNRPANEVTYCVVASPAGAYFPNGAQPISIWVSNEFVRAAPGGTGAAKFGGNYAASLAAQVDAAEHGCDQVCFLDVIERRWVEELGGMNVYAVFNDNSIVTPELSGTILEGITRASIIDLASDAGYSVSERKLDINELFDGAKSGSLREVFACGTAAVVNPIGRLVSSSADASINGGVIGPVTMHLRRALLDIQYGIAPDPRGWMFKLI
jgi:branched-chain amino acid aminotransferase